MERYKKGAIIYIGGLIDNVNPETNIRNMADYGLVIGSDDFSADYLPIMKYKQPFAPGRYVYLKKEYLGTNSKDLEGQIDLKHLYSTTSIQNPVGLIFNENIVNDIIDKRNRYLYNEELYKPVVRIRK